MKTIITIGREYGSGGRIIAQKVADRLQIPFYDKELIRTVAEKTGYTEEFVRKADQRPTGSFLYDMYFASQMPSASDHVFIAQSRVIREMAEKGGCVIVGRCADYVLANNPHCLRVFIHAPLASRAKRAMEEYGVPAEKVENYVNRQDKYRASYYNFFAGGRWGAASNYDLCINSNIGLDAATDLICRAAENMEKL